MNAVKKTTFTDHTLFNQPILCCAVLYQVEGVVERLGVVTSRNVWACCDVCDVLRIIVTSLWVRCVTWCDVISPSLFPAPTLPLAADGRCQYVSPINTASLLYRVICFYSVFLFTMPVLFSQSVKIMVKLYTIM